MAQKATNDLLLSCATLEREAFWAERHHLHPEEIQQQWESRLAEILSALKPKDPPRVVEMTRAVSDQPLPTFTPGYQMQRNHFTTGSKRLNHSHAPNQPTLGSSNRLIATGIDRPTTEEPWNGLSHSNKRRRTNAGGRQLPVQEFTPSDYVKKIEEESGITGDYPNGNRKLRRGERPSKPITTANLAPVSPVSPLSLSPNTSIASPLTDASTLPTSMSRDISTRSSLAMQFGMARLSSDSPSDFSLDPTTAFTNWQTPPSSAGFKDIATAATLPGAAQFDDIDLSAEPDLFPDAFLHSLISQQDDCSPSIEAHGEAVGIKNEDPKPSAASRQRRYQDQLARGTKPLLPKEDDNRQLELKARETTELVEPVPSPSENGKIAIPKLANNPEPVEKPKCTKCNKRPDGFRGPHELERHRLRDHPEDFKTFFICVDKSPNQKLLAGCKKCDSHKRYNAYYNTAAHIRRHFARAEGKRCGAGSSGGDYPSMEWLKQNGWIKKVIVDLRTNIDISDDTPTTTVELPQPSLGAPSSMLDIASEPQATVGNNFSTPPYDFYQDLDLDGSILFDWDSIPVEDSAHF